MFHKAVLVPFVQQSEWGTTAYIPYLLALPPTPTPCLTFRREMNDLRGCKPGRDVPGGSVIKTALPMQETQVRSLGQEDALEEGMATHCSVPAWRTPWTEEPGRLQSTGSQRGRHD